VLVKDKRQTLIHKVLELALDAEHSEIRSFAWHCLRHDVPVNASEVTTQELLSGIQSLWNRVGLVEKYYLELLQKCLRGLSVGGQSFSAEIRAQVLGVLKPLLELYREPEMRTLMMAALAFPDFVEADEIVESCLTDEVAELKEIGLPLEIMLQQGVQTLVEMESPRMWDWLVKLCQAKSESWPDSQKWASHTLAERAESSGLLHLPNDLRAIVYTAAVIHGIRFQRTGMRTQAIYPNGQVVNV